MLGIGMGELLLILVVALLFVGPEKLPGAARAISKGLRQVRGAAENIKQTVEKDKDLKEALSTLNQARASLQSDLDDIGGKIMPRLGEGDRRGGGGGGKAPVAALASAAGVGSPDSEPITRISKPRYTVEKVSKPGKPAPGSTDS
ncbi:MAG: twin-arginine translocase subunit TatB [Deltaproteobacteria bacterium]|nr:twin-arginine translocase subunit TatB [Deltaproteobacteria bacterium]